MKCEQQGCKEEATHEVFWPGQLSRQCEEHTADVQALGRFMGIQVEARPLPTNDRRVEGAEG